VRFVKKKNGRFFSLAGVVAEAGSVHNTSFSPLLLEGVLLVEAD
jgi:hypothetical protein